MVMQPLLTYLVGFDVALLWSEEGEWSVRDSRTDEATTTETLLMGDA